MGRSIQKGPIYGPYVTLRLVNTIAVNAATATKTDNLWLPANFRPCSYSIDARGITVVGGAGYAQAAISNSTGTGTGAFYTNIASGTPKAVIVGAGGDKRNYLTRGEALSLYIKTNDGAGNTSNCPAGAVALNVTGYFTEAFDRGRFYESGQSVHGGPRVGYYDVLTLSNHQAITNSAMGTTARGSLIVPYNCRVEAICTSLVGHDETTGSITMGVRNATDAALLVFGTMDADVREIATIFDNGTAAVGQAWLGTTTLLGGSRDLTRGDQLDLLCGAGAADVVGVHQLTAYVIVWVKGHYDATGVTDGLDGPLTVGGTEGPNTGNVLTFRLHNKRASNTSVRLEDRVRLPMRCRLLASSHCRITNKPNASRRLKIDDTSIGVSAGTINYLLHNEGTAIGSLTGNTIIQNQPAGSDSDALRNYETGTPDATGDLPALANRTLDLEEVSTVLGDDAILNSVIHAFVIPRYFIYTSSSRD